jgi:ankyrin repeat protein
VLRAEPERAQEVTENGRTPLWWLPDDDTQAIEVVELLLSYGTDPSISSKDGPTAADSAQKRGLDRVADMLMAAAHRQRADRDR